MNESREEYQNPLRREVILLEGALQRRIHHGQGGRCPRRSSPGRFGVEGLGFSHGFGNSIYFSSVFQGWRCRMHDYRMVA
jgi:hypothetical protein